MNSRTLFFVGLIIAASGLISSPIALAAGLIYGMSVAHPYGEASRSLQKFLLQASVVLLGFSMNLHEVIHAGRSGFLYTAISITVVLALGLLLGRMMNVQEKASYLIAAGTAICGGSAIAALAPITKPDEEEMGVSLGTVFLLNSVALLLFPAIGLWLHLSQNQFGLWCALAIHDTSSVVGAAAKYGPQALAVGTTVKLARALWIVPVSLATAAVLKSKTRVQLPWFILLFCGAAVLNTYLLRFTSIFATLNHLGRVGLTATLFLIGTGISPQTLKQVGWRPLVQGITLWAIIAVGSLVAIRSGLIAI